MFERKPINTVFYFALIHSDELLLKRQLSQCPIFTHVVVALIAAILLMKLKKSF